MCNGISGGSRPRAKGGGGGLDLLVISFFTQNKGGRAPWAPPLDPPLGMSDNISTFVYGLSKVTDCKARFKTDEMKSMKRFF